MQIVCSSNSLLLLLQKVNDNLLQIDNFLQIKKIFFHFCTKKRTIPKNNTIIVSNNRVIVDFFMILCYTAKSLI